MNWYTRSPHDGVAAAGAAFPRLHGEAPPYDESVALRRILVNYYAGNEHTLVDFLHLGATVISVVPFERTAT